ncbi:MAG: hypothetical protein KDA53_09395 [Hyphomonas sp.]|nr:hypothetical protein [Hyphomonas sp.]
MIGAALFHDANSALQTLIAVTVLLALVMVARKYVARHFGAGVAYALWLIPVLRLVLPPLKGPLSVMPFLHLPAASRQPAEAPMTLTVDPVAAEGSGLDAFYLAPPAADAVPAAPLPVVLSEATGPADSAWEAIGGYAVPVLFAIWAGGAILMLGLSLWRHHDFMQTVKREAVRVSPRLDRIAADVGARVGLKRLPVIASSFISSGPLVTGLIRPVVLLPAWFETDYDDVQQRAALAHELSHVRRGDLWALQVSEIFVALMWFNPLAYAARRAFRTDQEAACDADVLRSGTASPHAYGATLIKAVRSASQERLHAAAGLPLTHALKERLSRMTHPTPTRTRRVTGFAAASVLGLGALFGTASVTANAGEPDRKVRITGTHDHTLVIDGEEIKDRQIVILGEPFAEAELSAEDQAEIDRLASAMAEEGARIAERSADIAALGAKFALTAEESAELSDIMAGMSDMPLFEGLPFDMNFDFAFDETMSEEELEAFEEELERKSDEFEARMEAWGETFGERMEAWGERVEARAEAWEANFEPEFEFEMDEFEARMEAHADELERLMEDRFGDDFEDRIEAKADAIEEMAEECRDLDLAEGESRIISRNVEPGTDVKIVCVEGEGRGVLRSADVSRTVRSSSALTEEEKASFFDETGIPSDLAGSNE